MCTVLLPPVVNTIAVNKYIYINMHYKRCTSSIGLRLLKLFSFQIVVYFTTTSVRQATSIE